MTNPNITTPLLRDLLRDMIQEERIGRGEPGERAYSDERITAVKTILEKVQAAIDRGDLVTLEEYASEQRWATEYFFDWLYLDERMDIIKKALFTE